MARDVSKIAALGIELASYTSAFTTRGYTLAGESRDNGRYACVATVTAGGRLVAVGEDTSVKGAVNDCASRLSLPAFP